MFTQGQILTTWQKFGLVIVLTCILSVQSHARQEPTHTQAELYEMSLEQLMEVTVESSATLTHTSPRLVPAAMTIITQEQILASGARSLYELLDIYVPNLQWMRHHWEADVMGLRGIICDRNDKYLMLVNGRVMNERTHFGALTEQDMVLLSDIHHIDIVRGPGSALYGPGAVSMVINIVTFNADTFQGTEVTGRMGAIEEFYSGEWKHGQAFDDNDGGLFMYAGISRYNGADKYDAPQIYPFTFPASSDYSWASSPPPHHGPPAYSLPADGTQAGEPMLNAPVGNDGGSARNRAPIKLHAQIKRGNWNIWARYTSGGKEFAPHTGAIARHLWGWAEWNNMWWNGDTSTQILPWNANCYGYQQATGYVGYNQELAENLDIDYAFSYDMVDFERFWGNNISEAYREDEYQGKALLRWQPNDKHSIAFGGEFSHLELGLAGLGWPGVDPVCARLGSMPRWSTNLYSILGEHQWNINDRWTTFIGARLDDHTYTDWMFSPRAAIVHTPTNIDTWKLMWSRSVRANFEEEMKAQAMDPNSGDISDPEILDSVELRYERQQTKNLDLAASVFVHYNLQAISWDESTFQSSLAGTQREYGFEIEASYHTEKTRLTISHGYTKLYDFDMEPDRMSSFPNAPTTYITAEPYGYSNDLTNWSNNITKLTAQHKLDDNLTLDASLRIYWGFPGMEDFDEYYPFTGPGAATTVGTYGDATPYPLQHPVIVPGWDRAYCANVYLNLGLQYKPSDNLVVGLTGYNLLGLFDKDLNKRNYIETKGAGDFRSHAPAVSVWAIYRTH
jgi:outer membrane receptor for ferrienterochelin and colicin